MANAIDKVLEKLISRKLLVFITGTALMLADVGLSGETWGMLAVAYVGSQGFIDAIKVYRFGNANS
jgi:hypothetical protein